MGELAKKLPVDTLPLRGQLMPSAIHLIGTDLAAAEEAYDIVGGTRGLMRRIRDLLDDPDTPPRIRWSILETIWKNCNKAALRAETKQELASMTEEEIQEAAILLIREAANGESAG